VHGETMRAKYGLGSTATTAAILAQDASRHTTAQGKQTTANTHLRHGLHEGQPVLEAALARKGADRALLAL
jgi:hypothetical protein